MPVTEMAYDLMVTLPHQALWSRMHEEVSHLAKGNCPSLYFYVRY